MATELPQCLAQKPKSLSFSLPKGTRERKEKKEIKREFFNPKRQNGWLLEKKESRWGLEESHSVPTHWNLYHGSSRLLFLWFFLCFFFMFLAMSLFVFCVCDWIVWEFWVFELGVMMGRGSFCWFLWFFDFLFFFPCGDKWSGLWGWWNLYLGIFCLI